MTHGEILSSKMKHFHSLVFPKTNKSTKMMIFLHVCSIMVWGCQSLALVMHAVFKPWSTKPAAARKPINADRWHQVTPYDRNSMFFLESEFLLSQLPRRCYVFSYCAIFSAEDNVSSMLTIKLKATCTTGTDHHRIVGMVKDFIATNPQWGDHVQKSAKRKPTSKDF